MESRWRLYWVGRPTIAFRKSSASLVDSLTDFCVNGRCQRKKASGDLRKKNLSRVFARVKREETLTCEASVPFVRSIREYDRMMAIAAVLWPKDRVDKRL